MNLFSFAPGQTRLQPAGQGGKGKADHKIDTGDKEKDLPVKVNFFALKFRLRCSSGMVHNILAIALPCHKIIPFADVHE